MTPSGVQPRISLINIRDGTIHLPSDLILSRYLGADTICIAIKKKMFFFFLKNFDSTSIAIRYCCVAIFVFNSRPWEKVEWCTYTDCHNTKKIKNVCIYYCNSLLQFIVIFVCLLKTRQWKIVAYTLKRDCIWWVMTHINKNNASHLSKLLFQEHTHTQCIFKVHWTMKL